LPAKKSVSVSPKKPSRAELLHRIEHIDAYPWEEVALEVFRYQAAHNGLYARFLRLLGRRVKRISTLEDIPFLPIGLFKRHWVKSGRWTPQLVFTSSGTTGQQPSRHAVRDHLFYLENARRGFAQYYGDPSKWCILALLPSYLERQGSSLVVMVDYFIRLSRYSESGFFLRNDEALADALRACQQRGVPVLLFGVSFALLDFAERAPMPLQGVVIMETGGMKGRRAELTREDLHERLCRAFHVDGVHSEYGMTELFSQAYSRPHSAQVGRFSPTRTLRAVATEIYDPLSRAALGHNGMLCFIDLANVDTCSFIATEDVGRVHADGTFEVLGRLDAAEWRGCNLLIE
jgi:hypothetical protein